VKLPAYGRKLWDRRLSGERPRVVALLVGDFWKAPPWLPAEIPRLAVKTDAWYTPAAERFDWRVVAACTVLAIDQRLQDERAAGPDDWDAWLWLLVDVQRFARDVLLFTPAEDFADLPQMFAPERDLETYAWCGRTYAGGSLQWPPWWPYGETIFERERAAA
jgi:hypothetical protein